MLFFFHGQNRQPETQAAMRKATKPLQAFCIEEFCCDRMGVAQLGPKQGFEFD